MKKLAVCIILALCCVIAFAQSSVPKEKKTAFDIKLKSAEQKLSEHEYEIAKGICKNLTVEFAQYEELVDQANKLLGKIQTAANKESGKIDDSFNLSPALLTFSPGGGETEEVTVSVKNGVKGDWSISSISEKWCTVNTNGGKGLVIQALPNQDNLPRFCDVVVSFKSGRKTINRTVFVTQNPRPRQTREIRIHTTPKNARVSVGNVTFTSDGVTSVQEGKTPIHIMKNGYQPYDSEIELNYSEDTSKIPEFEFTLTPTFGVIKFSIRPSQGKLDDKNPCVFIGGGNLPAPRKIDLDPFYGRRNPKSFDNDDIDPYNLYADNFGKYYIPVQPECSYYLFATADEFDAYNPDYKETFFISSGQTREVEIVMHPKKGKVTFVNMGNADGAVIKDGSTPIATLGKDATTLEMTFEDHKISFHKEKFRTDEEVYIVNPSSANEDVLIRMYPLSYLSIKSEPQFADIFIDGVNQRRVTPKDSLLVVSKMHRLELKKEGYYPVSVDLDCTRDTSVSYVFRESHPLTIRTDGFDFSSGNDLSVSSKSNAKKKYILNKKRGYNIRLKEVTRGHYGSDLVDIWDAYTKLDTLNVPYGRYCLELYRYASSDVDKKDLKGPEKRLNLAHRSYLNFSEKTPSSIYRLAYSSSGLESILSADWHFLHMPNGFASSFSDSEPQYFSKLADASILKVKLINGLSTSVLKASVYQDQNNNKYLFNGTLAFLNGEFKLGGMMGQQFSDACLLLSYSWTPKIHPALVTLNMKPAFDYIDGFDFFAGIELSSRFPIGNINYKIGYSLAFGDINHAVGPSDYVTSRYMFNGLVMGLGITLGPGDSKGANILRVWY